MRKLASVGGVAAAIVLLAGLVAGASTPRLRAPERIHVIEHATSDTVTDTGAAGDTGGDLLTFANRVYDPTDTYLAGRDQGDCIRIEPATGKWECRWLTWVGGGAIAVEGPFYDTADSVLAITGGTGRFANARGEMILRSRAGGTEYDFIFLLEP